GDADAAEKPPSWGNAGHLAVEQVEPLASAASFRKALLLLLKGGGPVRAPAEDVRTWLPFFLRMVRASAPSQFRRNTAALAACMDRAIPAWRRLLEEAGQPDLLMQKGHYVVWESKRSAKASATRWKRTNTGSASWVGASREELGRLEAMITAKLHGGIRFQTTGRIRDPDMLLDALKHSVASANGKFVAARVSKAAIDRNASRLVTEDGKSFHADVVVIAAGLDSGRLLRDAGCPVPIIAERGYHIQSPAGAWPPDMPSIVFEDRAIVVTGFASALRATSFVEFARHDRPATPARWEMLERHVDELGLPFSRPRSRWMGARPTLPDYLPAIGKSALSDNLFYAFGHQHLGLTMAAVTGEIITDLVCGRQPPIDPRPFDVRRFSR
ncbi:MAG: FAD-binding oxidoreductase, partial [Woeseia sp.]